MSWVTEDDVYRHYIAFSKVTVPVLLKWINLVLCIPMLAGVVWITVLSFLALFLDVDFNPFNISAFVFFFLTAGFVFLLLCEVYVAYVKKKCAKVAGVMNVLDGQ